MLCDLLALNQFNKYSVFFFFSYFLFTLTSITHMMLGSSGWVEMLSSEAFWSSTMRGVIRWRQGEIIP